MRTAILASLLLALAALSSALPPRSQLTYSSSSLASHHVVDEAIYSALERSNDPVDALLHLQPHLADELAERRLIRVLDDEEEDVWMTEGDKLRLRRQVC